MAANMPHNDVQIEVEAARFPLDQYEKGAMMTGKRKTPEDGGAGRDDDEAKLPPPPTEEDEEDGDIATPKRDRDDEQRDL